MRRLFPVFVTLSLCVANGAHAAEVPADDPTEIAADDTAAGATEPVSVGVAPPPPEAAWSRATGTLASMPPDIRFRRARTKFEVGRVLGLAGPPLGAFGGILTFGGIAANNTAAVIAGIPFLAIGGLASIAGPVLGQMGWLGQTRAVREARGSVARTAGWISLGCLIGSWSLLGAGGVVAAVDWDYPIALLFPSGLLILASYISAEVQAGSARKNWRGLGPTVSVRVLPGAIVGTF